MFRPKSHLDGHSLNKLNKLLENFNHTPLRPTYLTNVPKRTKQMVQQT